MRGASIIIKKELTRVFGDRKLIFSLFILPAVLMIAIYGMIGTLTSSMQSDISEHVSNVYFVDAPENVKELAKTSGYVNTAHITYWTEADYAKSEQTVRDDVLEGRADLIVIFEENFEAKVAAYSKAGDAIPNIDIKYNSSENYSSRAYSTFSAMIENEYKTFLLSERIGNLEMLNIFNENEEVIVKEAKANSEFISMMLPYLLVLLLFAGAMSIGVDAIAGEKERGTLASMLLSPVSRRDIVVGKLTSMAILSGLSAIVYAVSMVVAMSVMGNSMGSLAESGFGNVSFGPLQIIQLLLIMVALVYLYVAIIALLAVLAKDVKTASSLISPAYIAVVVSGVITMFTSGKEIPFYRYMIPVYGNALAIKDICVNELSMANFGFSMLGTVLLGVIFTFGVVKAFNSEKIMFNA